MNSSPRRSLLFLCSLACAGLLNLVTPDVTFAGGDEYSASQDDIRIAVNWKWAGSQSGGYYPIRVALRNVGPTRTLTVNWKPYSSGMPVVSRTVTVDQNSSASFTLLAPLVGTDNNGAIHVYHDGQELKKLQHFATLAEMSYQGQWPAMLVISDKTVDASGFSDAVVSVFGNSASGGHYYGSSSVEADLETTGTSQLPDSWLAYSGLDIVSVSLATLEGLTEEQRTPLIEWMRTGGTLLIHSVGETVSTSTKLLELTGLAEQRQPFKWTSADVSRHMSVRLAVADQWGNVEYEADSAPQFYWEKSAECFSVCEAGLGRIVAFKDSPMGGSIHDWAWMLNSLPRNKLTWTSRFSHSS
jgi:hypothetical protein